MEVISLLECLQEIIDNASRVPITGKIMVDKDEISEVIDKIVNYLPDEFKKAQWIVEEKERIISEAKLEADAIKSESLEIVKKQIDTHDIVKAAQAKSDEILSGAQRDAKAMRLAARDYTNEMLTKVEKELATASQKMIVGFKKEAEDFLESVSTNLSSTSSTIRDNIKELRNMK